MFNSREMAPAAATENMFVNDTTSASTFGEKPMMPRKSIFAFLNGNHAPNSSGGGTRTVALLFQKGLGLQCLEILKCDLVCRLVKESVEEDELGCFLGQSK